MSSQWLPKLLILQVLCSQPAMGAQGGAKRRRVDEVVGRWPDIPKYVPSNGNPDGPLLGNGRLGAALAWYAPTPTASVKVEFHFGHNAFFAAPLPGFSSCGYTDITGGGRKALGGLTLHPKNITNSTVKSVSGYQRPSNGSAGVHFETVQGLVEVSAFVHAEEDVLVVRISAQRQPSEVGLDLWTYTGCAPGGMDLPTHAGAGPDSLRISRSNGQIYQAKQWLVPGVVQNFSLVARQLANQWQWKSEFTSTTLPTDCGRVWGTRTPCSQGLARSDTDGEMIFIVELQRSPLSSLDPPTKNEDAGDATVPSADSRSPVWNYTELRQSHVSFWDHFWTESFVEIPASPVTEFFWYSSQYLSRAASGGDASPGLFGPWVTTDTPSWSGDMHLNYNVQAFFYGAASSNHLEVYEPYIQSMLDFLPAARDLALVQFPNCENALYFPGCMLPYGVTSSSDGDMGQKQMGVFASVPLIFYWRYSRDTGFATRIMPFFFGIARFWECALVSINGTLHDTTDCSAEICHPDGRNQPDVALVLSLLPSFFSAAADLAESIGTLPADVAHWRSISRRVAGMPRGNVDGHDIIVEFGGANKTNSAELAWGGMFASFPLGTVSLKSSADDMTLLGFGVPWTFTSLISQMPMRVRAFRISLLLQPVLRGTPRSFFVSGRHGSAQTKAVVQCSRMV